MPPTKRTAETMAKGDTKTGAPRKDEPKIRRTLHFRFTLTGASEQMIAMIKSSAPMYQMFADAKVRLLQNVDDPEPLPSGDRIRRAGVPGAQSPAACQRRAGADLHAGLAFDVSGLGRDRRLQGCLRRNWAKLARCRTIIASLVDRRQRACARRLVRIGQLRLRMGTGCRHLFRFCGAVGFVAGFVHASAIGDRPFGSVDD